MEYPYKIDRQLLAKKLAEKNINANCSSCGKNNWAVMEEASIISQWTNMIPAPGIPAAVMICNNCGFIRSHALGALGMLPENAGSDQNEGAAKDE